MKVFILYSKNFNKLINYKYPVLIFICSSNKPSPFPVQSTNNVIVVNENLEEILMCDADK